MLIHDITGMTDEDLDKAQYGLMAAGLAPGGFVADLADAGISLSRGDLFNAMLATGAAIPGLGMAFGAGRLAKGVGKSSDSFYSRLERAISEGPEEFVSQKEKLGKMSPERTVINPKTGKPIKIPARSGTVVQKQQTANEKMMSYLEGRAHPQEIDWVLGEKFADAPEITKSSLLKAMKEGSIDLDIRRHGGLEKGLYLRKPKLQWLRHNNRYAGHVYMHRGRQPPMGAVQPIREKIPAPLKARVTEINDELTKLRETHHQPEGRWTNEAARVEFNSKEMQMRDLMDRVVANTGRGKIIGYRAWGPKKGHWPGPKLGDFPKGHRGLEAAQVAVEKNFEKNREEYTKLIFGDEPTRLLEHGPLQHGKQSDVIPGGSNTMEVPIRLGRGAPPAIRAEMGVTAGSVEGQAVLGEFSEQILKAKDIIRREGNLGFDDTSEAWQSILRHDDFAERWDLSSRLRNPADVEALTRARESMKWFMKNKKPIFPDPGRHFGDDVLGWVIHDQRKVAGGDTATFIQELQSDWHQIGRGEGYKASKATKAKSKARQIAAENKQKNILKELTQLQHKLKSKHTPASTIVKPWRGRVRATFTPHRQVERMMDLMTGRSSWSPHIAAEEKTRMWEGFNQQTDELKGLLGPYIKEWDETVDEIMEARKLLKGKIPDAPFKGNEWVKLTLRQALSDAIQRGDKYMILPPPAAVARTQGMPLKAAQKLYGEMAPNLLNEITGAYGKEYKLRPLHYTQVGISAEDLKRGSRYGRKAMIVRIPRDMIDDFTKRGFKFPMMSVGGAVGGGALAAQSMTEDDFARSIR